MFAQIDKMPTGRLDFEAEGDATDSDDGILHDSDAEKDNNEEELKADNGVRSRPWLDGFAEEEEFVDDLEDIEERDEADAISVWVATHISPL